MLIKCIFRDQNIVVSVVICDVEIVIAASLLMQYLLASMINTFHVIKKIESYLLWKEIYYSMLTDS